MLRTLGIDRLLKPLARRVAGALGYEILRKPVRFNPLWLHLREVLATQRIDCVLDVGAHHGEYASQLRASGYTGRIVSFEPIAENFAVLAQRAAADPLWSCHRLALSNRSGECSLHVTRDSVFSSMLQPNEFSHGWSEQGSAVQRIEVVPARRLDDTTLRRIVTGGLEAPRVFLKVDTQGADPLVIEGAHGLLPWVRVLQSELSVRSLYHGMLDYKECLAAYERAGYQVTGLFACAQEADHRVVEFDCVMIRAPELVHHDSSHSCAEVSTVA